MYMTAEEIMICEDFTLIEKIIYLKGIKNMLDKAKQKWYNYNVIKERLW